MAKNISYAQTPIWARSSGGPLIGWNRATSSATDAFGNVYITGIFQSPTIVFGTFSLTNARPLTDDIFIVKYDPNGNVLWAKSAGGTQNDWANGITTDANGNVYITGSFYSPSITFGTSTLTNVGSGCTFVVKYDNYGNLVWAKASLESGYSIGYGIAVDTTGNVYVTGSFFGASITFGSTTLTNSNPSDNLTFLVKYDKYGNVL